jgi:hypothetical protein
MYVIPIRIAAAEFWQARCESVLCDKKGGNLSMLNARLVHPGNRFWAYDKTSNLALKYGYTAKFLKH